MPIYLAIPLATSNAPLNASVESKVAAPDRCKLQNDRGWLIKFDGTTIELSNHLLITGQSKGVSSPIGSALVTPISGYYGRGPTDMWEWLKTRFET